MIIVIHYAIRSLKVEALDFFQKIIPTHTKQRSSTSSEKRSNRALKSAECRVCAVCSKNQLILEHVNF